MLDLKRKKKVLAALEHLGLHREATFLNTIYPGDLWNWEGDLAKIILRQNTLQHLTQLQAMRLHNLWTWTSDASVIKSTLERLEGFAFEDAENGYQVSTPTGAVLTVNPLAALTDEAPFVVAADGNTTNCWGVQDMLQALRSSGENPDILATVNFNVHAKDTED